MSATWRDGLVDKNEAIGTTYGASPAAPTSQERWRDGLVSQAPTLQGPAGPTSIGPRPVGAWERFTQLFSHIPAVNPLVSPEQERLIAPEELMTPAEQERHPIATALGEATGGFTSPENAAILAATGGLGTLPGAAGRLLPRLVSLGFSADMLYNSYGQSQAVREAMDRGDENAVLYHLTHGFVNVFMAGLAGAHGTGYLGGGKTAAPVEGEPAFEAKHGDQLTPAEQLYVQAATQANLQHGLQTGDMAKVAETLEAAKELRDGTITGQPNRPIQQVPLNAAALEGGDIGQRPGIGGEGPRPDDAQVSGAQAIRDDTGITRGEGGAAGDIEPGAIAQANERPGITGPIGPVEVATLGAVSNLHEAETGTPLNLADEGGLRGNGSVVDRPPAINGPVDTDLANGGITVIRPGKDLGIMARYLGSISQAAARLQNPFFKNIADQLADATIALARNSRDAINTFRSGTRAIVSPEEWKQRVVPLLNDPNVEPDSLPADLPPNIRQAYLNERSRLDQDRLDIIKAKRQAFVNSGVSADQAAQWVPDDWGIRQGYFHHAFPGNWTITVRTEAGEYEPIETGWRQLDFDAAHAKAREYLAANPDANLKVQLDTATLPGRNVSDKARLLDLKDEITAASTLIYNGVNPDGILRDLKEKAAAAAYGPRRPAQRVNAAVLQREANLPGWATDLDNYERYIMGIERYKVLAPARQALLSVRNDLASMTGMPEVQRISEMPRRYSGQYANMLGRTDASIEALEGYPTGLDAAVRNTLQHMGFDPNMVNRAYSYINSFEALLKLGFNPASAGLHLAQTVAATYPVLGEKWTLAGIAKAYSSDYAPLIHDLGIEATSNLLDIDTFNAYKGGYFNEPGLGAKVAGAYKVLQTGGLWMFSKGVETARRIAVVGAYEKGLSEGMSPEAARNYARDTLIRTQFMYSPADAPLVLRALPRPLTQFRTFTMKMMEYVTGLRGAEIPRFLIAMGAIGYAGLPALTALSSMTEKVTGYNPEDELKRLFPKASRGVLGFLGVDYTKNIGFADWLGTRSFDIDRLAGPAGSDLLNLGKAALALAHGPSRQGQQDIDTALRNVSPEIRRAWDESKRLATGDSALVDPRSNSIIIRNLTPGERLDMAAGLTPLRVAEERDTHDRIRKEIEQAKDVRGYFTDKLAGLQLEMMRSDISEQQRIQLVADTAKYAKMAQDYGVGQGLPKAVRERAREMFQERLQRDVRKAPKAVRPQAYQEQQQYQSEQP